jgi:[acyl-carrier-protein] S-malonyltransferase
MTNNFSNRFLFPGQGSQAVGMGKELADNYRWRGRTFEEADDALGYKLSELCFEGPEEKLKLTEITQPAILTASVAAWRVLQEKGLQPDFVAGHSLGEYSAHVAAGTIAFADAVRTVRNRGLYMQEAVPVGVGAMAAILGMPLDQGQRNCPGCGAGRSLPGGQHQFARADRDLRKHRRRGDAPSAGHERGAKKAVSLPVSAPFHCSLMQPAQDRSGGGSQRAEFSESVVSGDLQCGCGNGHFRTRLRARLDSPGNRHGAVGAVGAAADRQGRRPVY